MKATGAGRAEPEFQPWINHPLERASADATPPPGPPWPGLPSAFPRPRGAAPAPGARSVTRSLLTHPDPPRPHPSARRPDATHHAPPERPPPRPRLRQDRRPAPRQSSDSSARSRGPGPRPASSAPSRTAYAAARGPSPPARAALQLCRDGRRRSTRSDDIKAILTAPPHSRSSANSNPPPTREQRHRTSRSTETGPEPPTRPS